MDESKSDKLPSRPLEPRGTTLPDLVVLVLGCALGMALAGRLRPAQDPSLIALVTGWGTGFAVLQSLCLALALVIFARRIRYGRLGRPVQLLPFYFTMPLVATSIQDLLAAFDADGLGITIWWWQQLAALACPASFLAVAFLRKRLSGWGRIALLSFAVLCFWGGSEAYVLHLQESWAAAKLPDERLELFSLPLLVFVIGVVYGLPTAQALFDRPKRAWTWADWTSGVLAAIFSLLAIGAGFLVLLYQASWAPGARSPMIPAAAFGLMLSLALCLIVAWRQRARIHRQTLPSEPT